jgi:RNA polymerase sigma-70 factor (ECF subfamily)
VPQKHPRHAQDRGSDSDSTTTIHVQRAKHGDEASLDWIVRRFTPLLLAQARYRLGTSLRTQYDPEDLVSEVWVIALPRLPDLTVRDGRATPVLVKFLATTLLFRANSLMRKLAARSGRQGPVDPNAERDGDLGAALPDGTSGIVTNVVRREMEGAVGKALGGLDPVDREIILLRAVEQNSNKTVAVLLGIEPNAASMRYQRALERLRARVPGSVFDDFSAE